MSIEELQQQLQMINDTVEKLLPLFQDMSRDQLLENWMRHDEGGKYNEPVHQFAIVQALKKFHNIDAPLYPYEAMTEKQRFSLQPSYIITETEKRVRKIVEQNAAYAFEVSARYGFTLDEAMRTILIEECVRKEMAENGHRYWRE